VLSWPRRFQAYFDDNFGLRNTLTYLYSNALYHGFSVVPFGKVRMEADGWVFENLPEGEGCGKRSRFEKDAQQLARSVITTRTSVEAMGARYLLVLIPQKHFVYRPDAPHRACPPAQTPQGRLLLHLSESDSAFPVVDLFPLLVAQKNVERVYFLDDPHWNDPGAFVGYQAIAEALRALDPRIRPHPRSDFDEVLRDYSPGAFSRFANVELSHTGDVFFTPRYSPHAKRVGPASPLSRQAFRYDHEDVSFVNDDATLPTALVFRDSFFEPLRPLLAEHLGRVTYVWKALDLARVQKERPDIVIQQLLL
jgi:hypothetical protein